MLKKVVKSPLLYIVIFGTIFQFFVYNMVPKYTQYPDSYSYIDRYTQNIFKGEVNAARTPVYPYFCKLFINLSSNGYELIVFAQKILFIISMIIFYLSIRKISKNKIIPIVLTSIYSILPSLFIWNTLILTESISIFETVLLVYLTISYLKEPKKSLSIFVGIQIFLMVMTRPACIYLLIAYLMFWILKWIFEKDHFIDHYIRTGLITIIISSLLILVYCCLEYNQNNFFGLSNVSKINDNVIFFDSGIYKYSKNEEIVNDINSNLNKKNDSIWELYEILSKKYGENTVDEFIEKTKKDNKIEFLKLMTLKTINSGPLNIGVVYVATLKDYERYNLNLISNMIYPFNFSFIYIILLMVLIYILYYLIKYKKIEWLSAFLFIYIFGNLFLSLYYAPYETQRLCVTSIPVLMILISYFFNICYYKETLKYNDKNKYKKNMNKKENKKSLKYKFNILFKTKTNNTLIQFFRYIFVGGIAAVVNIGMLYVFTDIFHIYYLISNILSFILGLIVNYILSKKFVFQDETSISKTKEFIIYAIIGVIGLGIDTLFMWLLTDIIVIHYMISKIISTVIVFIWNFGARKVLYKIIQ